MEKTTNLNKKQREDKEYSNQIEDKNTIKTTECLEMFSKEGLQVVDNIGEVLYKNEDVLEGNKINVSDRLQHLSDSNIKNDRSLDHLLEKSADVLSNQIFIYFNTT